MEVIKQIVTELISNNKVVIFSKTYCPYCVKAKNAFESLHESYVAVELDERNDGPQIQSYLREMTGRSTVPNVFVNRKNIGGGDDTVNLLKSGKLKELLS